MGQTVTSPFWLILEKISDSMKVASGIENCVQGSYCLVVTRGKQCDDFLCTLIANDHLPDQPKLNLVYVSNIGERIVIRDAVRHAGL